MDEEEDEEEEEDKEEDEEEDEEEDDDEKEVEGKDEAAKGEADEEDDASAAAPGRPLLALGVAAGWVMSPRKAMRPFKVRSPSGSSENSLARSWGVRRAASRSGEKAALARAKAPTVANGEFGSTTYLCTLSR